MEVPFLIVVPTKDRRRLLERSLASALAQKYKQFRVVVVNDGSRDDTREYLSSLSDPRVTYIQNERSKGVNAARNAALRTIRPDEWAIQLDDDDMLLPGALETISQTIQKNNGIEVIHFRTIIRSADREEIGGYQFTQGEQYHDQSYEEVMTKARLKGDGRSALRASVFSRYQYSEDVNGFESEFLLRLARDGVSTRYVPQTVMLLDRTHDREHLSDIAARRDPRSFTRVHRRIFRDHSKYYASHPDQAMRAAKGAFKVALRALAFLSAFQFVFLYICACIGHYTGSSKE